MYGKPKCVWEAYIYFENHKQTTDKNGSKCTALKHCRIGKFWFESPFSHKIGDVVQNCNDFESFKLVSMNFTFKDHI